MLVLYDFGLSPYAQKVKIALREKDIPFQRKNGLTGEGTKEVRELSRRGEVPLLLDGSAVIADSRIILDYIDEKWPSPPLLPPDPAERARCRMLEALCDSEVEAIIYNLGELMSCEDGPEAVRKSVDAFGRAELKRIQADLSDRLGNADFFSGPAFGRADISVLPHMNVMRLLRLAPQQENLVTWLKRVNARPSVTATVVEVKESLDDFKALMSAVRTGNAQRQMRDHRVDWLLRAGGAPIVEARRAAGNIRFATVD